MQRRDGQIVFSASDLVNFLECDHLTTLDLINLDTPLQKTDDSDEAKLIQAKGFAHEAAFLDNLKSKHASVIDIAAMSPDLEQRVAATKQAMHEGHDIIFQATLKNDCFIGYADFLRKVPRPSLLGDWSYEVLDTKLSRSSKAKFIIQLGFYSDMVATVQGIQPVMMHVILGDQNEVSYRCADYAHYLNLVTNRFLDRVSQDSRKTYPVPCEKCDQCKWSDHCEEQRIKDDHLYQVANISRLQIKKLEMAGVPTLEALATLNPGIHIPKMTAETLSKLHH